MMRKRMGIGSLFVRDVTENPLLMVKDSLYRNVVSFLCSVPISFAFLVVKSS